MKRITVSGSMSLQFDADDVTSGPPDHQVAQALELVNRTLQREPPGLGAQIYGPYSDDMPEIEVHLLCDLCGAWEPEDEPCTCEGKE